MKKSVLFILILSFILLESFLVSAVCCEKVISGDWCQDAENPNKLVYLPAGGFIKVDTTTIEIFNVYDHANVLVYSNVIQKGTSLVYISLTKELEWEDYIHYKFVSRILSRVGINLAEDKVVQYAELQQKEGK